MPMPPKDRRVPAQASSRKALAENRHGEDRRQDRTDVDDEAGSARRHGEFAEVEQRGVERDEADATNAEAPQFATGRQSGAGNGEEDRGGNCGDGEADRAELHRTEGVEAGTDRRKGRRPGEDRDDDCHGGDRIGPG